jgi:hypothetical protein
MKEQDYAPVFGGDRIPKDSYFPFLWGLGLFMSKTS